MLPGGKSRVTATPGCHSFGPGITGTYRLSLVLPIAACPENLAKSYT